MASLNTLRTKFGFVLSAIIAVALLAFIFSLRSEMGFSSSDPVVGEINSEEVLYTEYYTEYQRVKNQSGMQESTEQQAAQLANAAWQSMISKKLLVPGFEQLGLTMSQSERMAVINGEVMTQTFAAAFTDPSTGLYNAAGITDFLSQSSINPEISAAWDEINEQARNERAAVKFNALVKAGSYANKLEVAQGLASINNTYQGKWISVPYSTISDEEFTVSPAEIKKYYQTNKALYKKSPSRTLRYVSFDFEPTDSDIVALENTALQAAKEFEAAEDLRAYVRGNLNATISTTYLAPAQFTDGDELLTLGKGKMYGPVNMGNRWTMSRPFDKIVAPDSIGVRHIVLNYTQEEMADSLIKVLKGGASFALAAQTHSLFAQSAQVGGEVGVMPFSAFTGEFIPALASAKKGDIVKVVSGDMIQIIEVYSATKPVTQFQVATVEYPIEASQSTIASLHTSAGMFSTAARGGVESFNASATEQGAIARSATINQGDRLVRTIEDSREIARWAYGAKVGDLSEVFKTDGGYVVAMLTEIDNEPYRSLESVSGVISSTLMRDKKFAKIAPTMVGATIEDVAQSLDLDVKDFNNVRFSSQYIPGIGMEPRLVGAITLNETLGLSAPVQGNSAAYLLDIQATSAEEPQSSAMERARAQAAAEDKSVQYIFNALQEMAAIKDLRGQFF